MRAGEMDQLIVLERRVETGKDGANNPVFSYLPIAEVWASKEDVRDSERVAAQEAGAAITSRFQIYWSPEVADLNPKDRLRLDGRLYDIVATKGINREGIEISALARAD